jgi:hypothetical protein
VLRHANCDFVRVRQPAIFSWLGAVGRGDATDDKPDPLQRDCVTLSSLERMAIMWKWHLTPWRSTAGCRIGIDADFRLHVSQRLMSRRYRSMLESLKHFGGQRAFSCLRD